MIILAKLKSYLPKAKIMLIDLSVALNSDTPVYPGDPSLRLVPTAAFDETGIRDHYLQMNTHTGTHLDAPSHMLNEGKSLGAFSIERFSGRGVLIDARDGFGDQLEKAMLQKGDMVLIWTGWSERFHQETYFTDAEELPDNWAQTLVDVGVSMVGLDQGSPDKPPFTIHKLLMEGDVLICENLTNLEALNGKEVTVFALPLKLDVDGAPARVVAEVR